VALDLIRGAIAYDDVVESTSNSDTKAVQPPVLKLLQDAVAGLTYPSESDEPWEPFVWPAATSSTTPRGALEQHVDKSRAFVEVPVEMFFEQLAEADNAKRYGQLRRRLLQQTLSNLSVFRVGDGEVRVDVFLIGNLADGSFAGMRTTSIET
jgi:hypothetical protein